MAGFAGPGLIEGDDGGEEEGDPEDSASDGAGLGEGRVEGERKDDDDEEGEEEHADDGVARTEFEEEIFAEVRGELAEGGHWTEGSDGTEGGDGRAADFCGWARLPRMGAKPVCCLMARR